MRDNAESLSTDRDHPDQGSSHELQCMEIWSGNRSVENTASSPGLDAWIFSRPYQGEACGGDVHYLSLCMGGVITRLVLADVSGHGNAVADTSRILKHLLRRFMNSKRQDRLVVELNRSFHELEQRGRFATAVVATFLSHKRRLLLTNAGHPRPLYYRNEVSAWGSLNDDRDEHAGTANLPLGIIGTTAYEQFERLVAPGDWLILYTDALTEATGADGQILGEDGLLRIVRQIPMTFGIEQFGHRLISEVISPQTGSNGTDDTTLIVLRFCEKRRIPGLLERLRGYAAVFRQSIGGMRGDSTPPD